MIISRAPKSFRWFYGVSLACGAMCLILAIGGRAIAAGGFGAAAGVFGYLAGKVSASVRKLKNLS